MRQFMDDDFLLGSDTAKKLFEQVRDLPILDYHCHLSPKEIWENKPFTDVTDLMLGGDHYKWRLMLANGAPEELIYPVRKGDPKARFRAYAQALSYAPGNPLFHWTHLELQRVFGIRTILTEDTADGIYDETKALLAKPEYLPRALIRRFRVEVVCTTDDPADSLEYHRLLAGEDLGFRVLPTFRPDRFLYPERTPFLSAVAELEKASGKKIGSYRDLVNVLEERAAFFASMGCRLSDHSLEFVPWSPATDEQIEAVFASATAGNIPDESACRAYRTRLMTDLGRIYSENDWAMQLHLSAMRNNSTRKFGEYGADSGFDSMDDPLVARNLSRLLDAMDRDGRLPRTILYSLNPKDNYTLASLLGNFQASGVPGKIQLGSGWWFNDQLPGMIDQMTTLASVGLLGRFVGMLTDSRSFISYPRHEYFRRILCNLIGSWVENGEFPDDPKLLTRIVQGVSYENAKAYFRF